MLNTDSQVGVELCEMVILGAARNGFKSALPLIVADWFSHTAASLRAEEDSGTGKYKTLPC